MYLWHLSLFEVLEMSINSFTQQMLSECKSGAHKSLDGLDAEDENTSCLHCREREIMIQYHTILFCLIQRERQQGKPS